jgi:hypothetical protein
MMTDQHRYASALAGRHQLAHFIKMHAHRFFQQHRHAGGNAVERGADMQGVGVGDDHRFGTSLVQHLPVVGEIRHAALSGERLGLRAGVGDGAQLRFGECLQVLVMLTAHDTGADQGNTQGGSHALILLLSCSRGCAGCSGRLFNI